MRPILYVPSLSINLFSVLYLTMHHHFNVSIELDKLHFIRGGHVVFQAKVSMSNAAYLVEDTIPVEEFASLSSTATLPMDLTLLHHRLCHHHPAGINLMTGLKLDSKAEPDPVCEACKAGKMHADPFPSSFTRASRPSNLFTATCMAQSRSPLTRATATVRKAVSFPIRYTYLGNGHCPFHSLS
jgi:hypothetical protein